MCNSHETVLEVDLKKLEDNYNYLKKTLNKKSSIIAVVKAFGYGHGDAEISLKLQDLGVNKFWVADFEEGVNLRKSGIQGSIIVANPGMKSFDQVFRYNLEVVIHNRHLLDLYIKKKKNINIHIKFNTGMNRYGFNLSEIEKISSQLKENPHIKIKSICSHLSSANDEKLDSITKKQIKLFEEIIKGFEKKMGRKFKKHLLNSHGFLKYKKYQYDMIRIGIALFGAIKDQNLTTISTLKSVISDNRNLTKGERIGYNGELTTKRDMNISTVPLGYADGINRKLGNYLGEVSVSGVKCPIIGNISMDSLMIDTTNVNCQIGDTVEVFNDKLSIFSLAQKNNTIPYEIYATLNRRIKRVYKNI